MTDNPCWITGKTKKAFTIPSNANSGNVSATTLRASMSWTANDSTGIVCTITCNGTNRTCNNGAYVGFTGLAKGTAYTISWKIVDSENNEVTGSFSLTTKKASFATINITSKIIQFSSKSNKSADTMEQKLGSEAWYDIEQNESKTHNNLTHNKQYNIYCRIKNCFAFNTSGNQTTTNDSQVSKVVNTKLLSVVGSVVEEHQHSIVSLWQCKVSDEARDFDAIDGYEFRFTSKQTVARKKAPYQRSEVIVGVNGNTDGNYQEDKKVYSRNLTWYYCEYVIQVSITDGYNVVSAELVAHTLFPAAWIYSNGQWNRYMGHVYTGGQWVPAPLFVYDGGRYKEPNGE